MSMINRYLHGEINATELRAYAKSNPVLLEEAEAAIAKVEAADEAALIAGASKVFVGTEGSDTYDGDPEDELIVGLGGDDNLQGGGGADVIMAGDGNDLVHGGLGDGADDTIYGGDGNDMMCWTPKGDGNDFFDGGNGRDYIMVSLAGTRHNNIQEALEAGYIRIDIDDDPGFDPKFTQFGSLMVPDGASGVVTGPAGETLTFRNVERIKGC